MKETKKQKILRHLDSPYNMAYRIQISQHIKKWLTRGKQPTKGLLECQEIIMKWKDRDLEFYKAGNIPYSNFLAKKYEPEEEWLPPDEIYNI